VLEHMYFKGTPTRGVGEIAKQTKAVGGFLNAATIYDHTVYYTVLPSSGFSQGLDVQADAYARSLIDADELARELEVIIQEAKRKADNPSAVAKETCNGLHQLVPSEIQRRDAADVRCHGATDSTAASDAQRWTDTRSNGMLFDERLREQKSCSRAHVDEEKSFDRLAVG